tara:strand:+ start:28 stop:516 length:489 start_codon:yes stop_codon:yes gene_type:complete
MTEENNPIVLDIQASNNLVFPSSSHLINNAINIAYEKSEISYDYSIGITVRLVDYDEGLRINSKFNNKSNATNVLAFIGDLDQEKELGLSPPFLGDIVVCLDIVEQEASASDINVSSHFIHMVVHGFLHLLGYDHFNDEEENKMKLIENKVLAVLDERGELN